MKHMLAAKEINYQEIRRHYDELRKEKEKMERKIEAQRLEAI